MVSAIVPSLAGVLAVVVGIACANPLFTPASAGSMRETQFDRFRKGFRTVDSDYADQFDSDANLATYDRASVTGAGTQSAQIAGGAGPFSAGSASAAVESKSLLSEYDRGALATANARELRQAGRRASMARDVGVIRGGAASDALIGGPVAGAGSSYQDLVQARDQATADSDSIDQHLAEDALVSEQFDRGLVRKDAASAAMIDDQVGRGSGAVVASEGQQIGQVDESRSRGQNLKRRSLVADSTANTMQEAYHKQLGAKAGGNDVVLLGPTGSSLGRSASAEHQELSQGTLQHADSTNNRVVNAANTKMLDNTWTRGSQQKQVAIGAVAPGGEISSGQEASHLANGYDRVAETDIANSAAKRRESSTLKTFDDREVDQAHKSQALIGGCV